MARAFRSNREPADNDRLIAGRITLGDIFAPDAYCSANLAESMNNRAFRPPFPRFRDGASNYDGMAAELPRARSRPGVERLTVD